MSSNLLITVPGGESGPSGVLVCSESKISWHHQGCNSISVRIPRRDKGQIGKVLIIAHCILKRKVSFII
jgi:splicing factor 3B subunit 3